MSGFQSLDTINLTPFLCLAKATTPHTTLMHKTKKKFLEPYSKINLQNNIKNIKGQKKKKSAIFNIK